MSRKTYKMSYDRALEKAMRYCSYQERCILDLEQRFYAWNVDKSDWDEILDKLMELDFLNEDRYVEDFVRGKLLMKNWGKNKIKAGLLQKRISGTKVQTELNNIDDKTYHRIVLSLIEKKKKVIEFKDKYELKEKLYRYLIGKGFESEIVLSCLKIEMT